MFAVWLLPVVTLIVASSTGGVLCKALIDVSPSHTMVTVTFSVAILTIGFSLAFMMLTVYLLRLIVYGLPTGATIISVFLPLGPTGQAGYSLLLIGQIFKSLLPLSDGNSEVLKSSSTGDTINVICVCAAFGLWSLATMWLIFALLALVDVLRQARVAFRVPFWGLIFPNVSHIYCVERSQDLSIFGRAFMQISRSNFIGPSTPHSFVYTGPFMPLQR
jgi:tellurite resistance protein TehA-like permease